MNDAALYEAIHPTLRHYLFQIENLLENLPSDSHGFLEQSLVQHSFTAAEHLETAIGFVLRAVYPLLEREESIVEDIELNCESLIGFCKRVILTLENITEKEFDGSSDRVIRHTAGNAQLEQTATEYVTLFALPNFFFHYSCAFAILRSHGVSIGKADFDGQHEYPIGFHF